MSTPTSSPPDPAAPLTAEATAELRHDLRTPVNHIVGYADMLLEDAVDPDLAARRPDLEETLAAARDVLAIIERTLASRGDLSITSTEVVNLYGLLREPQRRIVEAGRRLLALTDPPPDPAFTDDLQRILGAAEKLVPALRPDAAPALDTKRPAPDTADDGEPWILVVDDLEDNREVLRRRLRREGYNVECADDGKSALGQIGTRRYDLILLDVMMPEIDGYEVLERLKAAPETRDIPVIMISALDDMSSIVRCIQAGAEDYLPKPFDAVLLRARISASLEKKRLRDKELEYLSQLRRIVDAASAVEAGTYKSGALAEVAKRGDELGHLARVFDGMAAEVRAREDRLRHRLEELRSDIGIARTSQERASLLDGGSLKEGECFGGRYQIISVMGSGGMGTVYRARDLDLDEEVAIKTLRPELVAVGEQLIERFKREIRLARRISHRNVVRTHDFGEWRGVYYLTMEIVEGITVRELIDLRGPLTPSSALAIGTQLAESLVVAHEQGIIHRDIKPQNLLLDDAGVLKVMDFGIARLAERSSTLTEAGLLIGTPAYMSPEQLLSETVDGRSDLYAVGVVLYECVVKRLPFDGATPVSLITKVMKEEAVAPSELNPEVPPALSAVIMKLLAKDPENRVRSAAALVAQLGHIE